LIRKCFVSRDRDLLVKAYTTYVRPLLKYCTVVWSPHHTGFVNYKESVQRNFTKKIRDVHVCLMMMMKLPEKLEN